MTKSRVCAEKTINLAKQSCAKKTNLLVYERQKENEPKPAPRIYKPPICNPPAKRIKICTRAELKKICPPPPCPCPPPTPRPGLLTRLGRLLAFGAKCVFASAAVYVTYDMGIWGNSQETADLYRKICHCILPNFIEPAKKKHSSSSKACQAELELFNAVKKDEYCCDKFPFDHESGIYELQQKWNTIVSTAFASIVNFAVLVTEWPLKMFTPSDNEICKTGKASQGKEEDDTCTCGD